jgi:hypothetical protein
LRNLRFWRNNAGFVEKRGMAIWLEQIPSVGQTALVWYDFLSLRFNSLLDFG